MKIEFGSSFATTGIVTLEHGTAMPYAESIVKYGLDYEKLIAAWPGAWEFCTTMNTYISNTYASLNPLVQMSGATPAVVRFNLPASTITYLRSTGNPRLAEIDVYDEGVRFRQGAFAQVMLEWSNVTVREVPKTVRIDW